MSGVESLAKQLWGTNFYAERARRIGARLKGSPELTAPDAEMKRQVSREMIRELKRKRAE